jgi:hypothetical protein
MTSVLGAEKLSLVEIETFLSASESVRLVGSSRAERYGRVERLLCHHEYWDQKRPSKGLLRAYLEGMTGFSRARSTRLIGGYLKAGRVVSKPSQARVRGLWQGRERPVNLVLGQHRPRHACQFIASAPMATL